MNTPPVQYVTTSDGYDIAYMTCGEGQPLVFMPPPMSHIGLFWRSRAMRPAFEELARRFRLIQYDQRGQSLSMRGLRDDLSRDSWQLDLEAIVAREGLDHFILLGAFNGYVAVQQALNHPERVDALVLWNAGLTRAPSSLDDLAIQSWDLFLEAVAPVAFPWEERSVARQMVDAMWTPEDLVVTTRAGRGMAIEGLLGAVQVPTLVLATGAGSYALARESDGRRSAALIPGARLVEFDEPGGGFFGYGDQLPPAPGVIEDFFNEVIRRRAGKANAMPGVHGAVEAFLAPLALVASEVSAMGAASIDHDLSPRELDVLRLLAAGRSNQQIADELVISLNTVRRHVSNIFDKTGVANRAQAGAWAREHGLA